MREFDPFSETYEDFLNRADRVMSPEDSFNSRLGTDFDRIEFSKYEEERLLSAGQELVIQRLLNALGDATMQRKTKQIYDLKVKICKLESQLADMRKILNAAND